MSSNATADKRIQVLLTGIGGQGILFATRILAECGLHQGLKVIGSETHGMSQRGGSVTSHLKLGACHCPLIRPGDADALLAFEADEAYRGLRYLRPASGDAKGGVLFANASEGFPQPEVRKLLNDGGVGLGVVDASRIACDLGSPVVANLVLLGFASADPRFPFGIGQLRATVTAISPSRFLELNDRALGEGHTLGVACLEQA